jgi:hypothetical protein
MRFLKDDGLLLISKASVMVKRMQLVHLLNISSHIWLLRPMYRSDVNGFIGSQAWPAKAAPLWLCLVTFIVLKRGM